MFIRADEGGPVVDHGDLRVRASDRGSDTRAIAPGHERRLRRPISWISTPIFSSVLPVARVGDARERLVVGGQRIGDQTDVHPAPRASRKASRPMVPE